MVLSQQHAVESRGRRCTELKLKHDDVGKKEQEDEQEHQAAVIVRDLNMLLEGVPTVARPQVGYLYTQREATRRTLGSCP
jgi:hypothetical protein